MIAGEEPPDPAPKRTLRIALALAVLAVLAATVGVVSAILASSSPPRSGSPVERPGSRREGGGGKLEALPTPTASSEATGSGVRPQPTLALGTFRPASTPPKTDCPPGMDCRGFSVSCPDVQEDVAGLIAVGHAYDRPHGVVAFFSGSDGTAWWSDEDPATEAFLEGLRRSGLTVVQVRWQTPWLDASAGEHVGPARLACRPATVIDRLHTEIPSSSPGPGPCGFCVTGNSAGASQVSYALTRYGLESVLDMVVPTSGPPHAAIADGCRATNDSMGYGGRASLLDASMGFFSNGPCRTGDTRWDERWAREGVESGDLLYPNTSVRFIFGALDAGAAPRHGVRYYLELRESGSPHVTAWVVPCMAHGVQSWPAGLDTLRVALTEPVVPEPVATAPVTDCTVPTPDKTFTIPSVSPSDQP